MSIKAEPVDLENVRITITAGPVLVEVVMEHEELSRFWHDLGQALEATDRE